MRNWIEKKNPLKQGLKLDSNSIQVSNVRYWKEESIKTRIETPAIKHTYQEQDDWKEESIKTRIETIQFTPEKVWTTNWKEESIKTRIETPLRIHQ